MTQVLIEQMKNKLREDILFVAADARGDLKNKAEILAAKLNRLGAWDDIEYTDHSRAGWKPAAHLDRCLEITKAARLGLVKQYGMEKVLNALKYWCEQNCRSDNAFWNIWAVPRKTAEIMLLMENRLDQDLKEKGLRIVRQTPWKEFPEYFNASAAYGANLLFAAISRLYLGMLENDLVKIRQAFKYAAKSMNFTLQGIQPDFSYLFHGPLVQMASYGWAHSFHLLPFVFAGFNTEFEFNSNELDIYISYLVNGEQWVRHRSFFDHLVAGRGITIKDRRKDKDETSKYIYRLERVAELPVPKKHELIEYIQRLKGSADTEPLVGNRHFWKADMMAHHRLAWYGSARMLSNRTLSSENTNEEGLLSHYLAEGANTFMVSGEEYFDIAPLWDWQKIPGTTVVLMDCLPAKQYKKLGSTRLFDPGIHCDFPMSVRTKGETIFAGGVSDGVSGIAAMDHKRYDLTGRKAWFFFDDSIVCLGAGITCPADRQVITTINQCLLKDDVYISKQEAPLSKGEHELKDTPWIYHNRFGYILNQDMQVNLVNSERSGSWYSVNHRYPDEKLTGSIFSLWIDHGRKCLNSSYSYTVLPDTDVTEIQAWINQQTIKHIQNTASQQAVFNIKQKILGVCFYNPGEIDAGKGWNIKCDYPCIIMIKQAEDGLIIALSNPANQPAEINIEIDRKLRGEGVLPRGEGIDFSVIRFCLPGGTLAGKSVIKSFRENRGKED